MIISYDIKIYNCSVEIGEKETKLFKRKCKDWNRNDNYDVDNIAPIKKVNPL